MSVRRSSKETAYVTAPLLGKLFTVDMREEQIQGQLKMSRPEKERSRLNRAGRLDIERAREAGAGVRIVVILRQ